MYYLGFSYDGSLLKHFNISYLVTYIIYMNYYNLYFQSFRSDYTNFFTNVLIHSMGNESINPLALYNYSNHNNIRHTILELHKVLLRTFPPMTLINKM
jgi:hypothetical protein